MNKYIILCNKFRRENNCICCARNCLSYKCFVLQGLQDFCFLWLISTSDNLKTVYFLHRALYNLQHFFTCCLNLCHMRTFFFKETPSEHSLSVLLQEMSIRGLINALTNIVEPPQTATYKHGKGHHLNCVYQFHILLSQTSLQGPSVAF